MINKTTGEVRHIVSPADLRKEAGVELIHPMLTGESKLALATSRLEFYITEAIFLPDAAQGSCWQFMCEAGKYSFGFFMGDPMKVVEGRDTLDAIETEYQAIHDVCMTGAAVGPYVLRWVERTNKPSFYSLEPAFSPLAASAPGGPQLELPF